MKCVISNCAPCSQNYMHRFPRSSFLYERWRQAIELGTGQCFPREVDPLEVVICQQHFTCFEGYQEPTIFHNVRLNRQIQLECCRLCLKVDFSEQILAGCGDRIVGEKTVKNLLGSIFGIELPENDRRKGICRECLDRLEVVENTLRYFSKKNHRWIQMQELIQCEDIQWHGNSKNVNDGDNGQSLLKSESDMVNVESDAEAIKIEIEDSNIVKESNNPKKINYEFALVPTSWSNDKAPLVQIPLQPDFSEKHSTSPILDNNSALTIPGQSYEPVSDVPYSQINQAPPLSSHVCHICSKIFTKATGLRTHLQIHQGIKNFKCQSCGRLFRTRKNWKIHETLHRDGQAYTCGICAKSFTHPSNLKRHELLHAGAKDFECNLCGKRFSRLNHLHVHLRAHTGEKPYKCPKCGGSFSTSSGLSKHRRKVCKFRKQDNDLN